MAAERPTSERCFRALGADCHVIVVDGDPTLLEIAVQRVAELERRWSRFLPGSEVSRLNAANGRWTTVSPETALLLQRSLAGYWFSRGAFDATVLGDVVRAGYDRTFELVTGRPGATRFRRGSDSIEIDGDRVRLGREVGFDPGGIGKGLAADLVVELLLGGGAAGACVNLGGDLRVSGMPPTGEAWTVAVDAPDRPTPVLTLGLGDGAVATSSTLRRRWISDGDTKHHLIDPATGSPSRSEVVLATAVAGEAWAAEVVAKTALLRGEADLAFLDGTGAEAFVLLADGRRNHSAGLPAYLGTAVGS
jgi:thiamine biosynthesis lipoprotein